jgi:hypothetical protein
MIALGINEGINEYQSNWCDRYSRVEFNGFEAFTTFIHGKTKYSAPRTEDFIFRETLLGRPLRKNGHRR